MRRVVWENVTRWACLVCEKSVEIREICGQQLSAQCAKEQAGCFYSPTDLSDKHRCHAGCFYQKTRIAPMRTDGSSHGFFTLAPLPTAWVIDAPSAQRIATDFFAGGELYAWENATGRACLVCEKSVEICGICGRQISAQCAKEQAGCFYSPTDRRCHAG